MCMKEIDLDEPIQEIPDLKTLVEDYLNDEDDIASAERNISMRKQMLADTVNKITKELQRLSENKMYYSSLVIIEDKYYLLVIANGFLQPIQEVRIITS